MATKQEQWQEYLQEYNSKLQDAKQHVDSVVNSGTATQAEKDKARSDYAKQLAYYNILQGVYNAAVESGTFPDTFDIDSTNKGSYSGIYTIAGDSTIYMSTIVPCDYMAMCAVSDHFEIHVHVYRNDGGTVIDLPDMPYISNLQPGYGQDTQGYYAGFVFHADYSFDTWVVVEDVKQFFNLTGEYVTVPSGYDITWFAAHIYDNSTVPEFTQGEVIRRGSLFGGQGLLITLPEDDVPTDNPWDYYNDDILPGLDPNNAAFPDGYEPVQPDDPPDEPTDMPHDDGEPPDQQRDRAVGLPTQFITQYLLSYSQLQTFGLNLWQSWLTPNTDVWKNFFLPYGQDFGTLNIGACLDFIVSLRVYPVNFADYLDLIGSSDGLYMGTGHTDFLGSNCAITRKLFHAFYCGTCEVKPEKPYNDYRDMYNTSVSVVLPYCGTVELTPAEVMYRTLRCYYYVDFQSGACTAVVEIEGDSGWYMIASKTGQMGFLLPITATNAGQLSAQFGKDATETLGTLAGFFFDVAGAIGQSTENMANILAFNKKQEDSSKEKDIPVGMTITQSLKIGESGVNTGLALANQALNRLSRSGIDMPMLSGGGGTESLMFPDTPYIQIRRGKYAKPDNYPHSQGFLNGSSNTIEYYKGAFKGTPTIDPSYKGRGLCKFTGVDSTGLTCNNDERVEIINLLESGIYI